MVATAHDASPAKAPPPLLELRGVSKRFGSNVVLDDLSLSIERHKTTVMLGPSGTGKSVLLKLVVGLLRPDRGEIRFDGARTDVLSESGLRPIRRRIGFLFQLSALFDSMTIAENLEFPLREHTSMRRAERRGRIAEALRRVDLPGIEGKFPGELSGGQQKRAALARAIMLEPELLLYDEPTTGLDPIRAAGINTLINSLREELGTTSIVVTHDLESATTVGDRIIMLRRGRLIADGTMDDLRQHDDESVRAFMEGHAEEPEPTGARGDA